MIAILPFDHWGPILQLLLLDPSMLILSVCPSLSICEYVQIPMIKLHGTWQHTII